MSVGTSQNGFDWFMKRRKENYLFFVLNMFPKYKAIKSNNNKYLKNILQHPLSKNLTNKKKPSTKRNKKPFQTPALK